MNNYAIPIFNNAVATVHGENLSLKILNIGKVIPVFREKTFI